MNTFNLTYSANGTACVFTKCNHPDEPEFAAVAPGRLCGCSRTGACVSAQDAVSTGHSILMRGLNALAGRGRHRSQEQFHACGAQARIRRGAGTSPRADSKSVPGSLVAAVSMG